MAKAIGNYFVQGFSAVLAENDTPPESVQLFPPGKHRIKALVDNKPDTMELAITSKTADALKSAFDAMLLDSTAGTGPRPFLDFNHEDRDASAWVDSIYWAGEDAKTGGVRAKVQWTKPGAEAITGKSFRQFSPNFLVDKLTGEIVGAGANMGGLVNRPAFRGIEPFFAKEAQGEKTEAKSMNKLHEALIAAGLLATMPTDEATALTDFTLRWQPVQAKLARVPELEASLAKATATVSAKEAELVQARANADRFALANAETVVAKAVADGILAPKDEAGKAKWLALIKNDPDNAGLLATFNVSAKAAVEAKVIGGQAAAKSAGAAGAGTSPKEQLEVLAMEIETTRKVSAVKAMAIVAQEHPELYEAYTNSLRVVA